MRRFTRLTNGFSKKVGNHAAMIAIFYLYYNFLARGAGLQVRAGGDAGKTIQVLEGNGRIRDTWALRSSDR